MRQRLQPFVVALSALFMTACVTQRPYADGVALYRQGDLEGAYGELAPLAARGDAVSQYFAARITLKRKTTQSAQDFATAREWLVASARQGNVDALALAYLLAMSPSQYASFYESAQRTDVRAVFGDSGFFSAGGSYAGASMLIDGKLVSLVEEFAGGPVSFVVVMSMIQQARDLGALNSSERTMRITPEQLLAIDTQRAENGDKYAQIRLANRYVDGRDVARDLKRAFELRLKAAKTAPAPRSCVYQAPVGGGASSVYCYDAGPASAGLPQAMLDVCRDYARGAGVEKNPAEARKWCERARNHEATKTQAEKLLAELND